MSDLIISQTITYSAQLKNDVEIKELYKSGDGEFKIKYYKSGDHIVRLEQNKVQLFTKNFEQLWEYYIPLIEGYGSSNYHKLACDENYIYVISYNVVVKAENSRSTLTRIDYSGNVKSIDFTTVFQLRSAYALEIVNGDLYVIAARATGSMTPYYNTVETSAHVICLDSEMNQKGKVADVPYSETGTENNLYWEYTGIHNGNFTFYSGYHRTKNGKPSADSKDQFFYEKYSLSSDLEVVEHTRQPRPAKEIQYLIPDKYDPKRWQVTTDSGFSSIRGTVQQMRTTKLFIESNEAKSPDLVKAMYDLSTTGKKDIKPYFETYTIDDIVYDPINDIVLVSFRTVSVGQQYLAFLNHELKPVKIYAYIALLPNSIVPSQPNVSLDIKEVIMSWESPENKLVKNGFDLAMEKADKSQFTFLNYDDYQIVLHDNFYTKQTWGYKVIR
ncbi:MAG: hypothetical protein HYZ14_16140 [Bacteroidetes bacterium]|nr:hypothetical protein [Bacteroidota bacterium]